MDAARASVRAATAMLVAMTYRVRVAATAVAMALGSQAAIATVRVDVTCHATRPQSPVTRYAMSVIMSATMPWSRN
jgi:hypothetical protein